MTSGTLREILILKSHPQDFSQMEVELRESGWTVIAVADLQHCLTLMAVHMPQFVMIDLDFPLKNISQLPTMLNAHFPVSSSGFLKENSTRAMAEFIGSGLHQKIFPPLNAKNILRQLGQFKRDELLRKKRNSWPKLEQRCLEVENILSRYDVKVRPGEIVELAQVLDSSMQLVIAAIHQLPAFNPEEAS